MTAQSNLKEEAALLEDVVLEAEFCIRNGKASDENIMTYLLAMMPVMRNSIQRIFEIDEHQRTKLKEALYGYYHEHPEARRPRIAA